jgi:hypothetical protein
VKDSKGILEVDNIKIEDLGPQVDKLRDGSIYIAGLAAGARIVKSTTIPLGAKFGATIGLGAASLIGYKIVHNSLIPDKHTGKVTASIDKISASVIDSSKNKSKFINNLTDGSSEDHNTISSLDIEQLQLIFYLNLILIYLSIVVLMFLLMKYISTLNLKFDFLLKLPYGSQIKILILKIIK